MIGNVGLGGFVLITLVVMVLFGRGKISSFMGELGQGLRAFKEGVKDRSVEEIEKETPVT